MTQPMTTFLTALQAVVIALPSVPNNNTATYPMNSEQWVNDSNLNLPFVQMFEGSMRADWWVTMACDRVHSLNVWVYAQTRDECRSIQEAILDAINVDLRVGGAAIYCKLRTGSPPYFLDPVRPIFLEVWEYDVRLRSDIP
jgi:hypothetical protein